VGTPRIELVIDFEIIPAIDLLDGRCVRLEQGDYQRQTVFSEHPAAMAAQWEAEGARTIHVVDLDGARSGVPRNLAALKAIRSAVACTIHFGGGLRHQEAVEQCFQAGADRVVLGTTLVTNPDWVRELCARDAERVVVGIDVKEGHVATDGWLTQAALSWQEAVERANNLGVRRALFTDIRRDGTLQGPNTESLAAVVGLARFAVIASGGISRVDDIEDVRRSGASAVIVGRALYTGAVGLSDAIRHLSRAEGSNRC
jgi:phosphoribosylformimino-5-aminoimidazole carboxamide ribotide isomerase